MEDIKISPTAQHIINEVRKLRLELGLTQRELSKIMSPDSDFSIVSNIESIRRSNRYTDHQLNIIATHFGRSIYDFYPAEPLSDTPQVKTKVAIPKGLGPTGIINALLEEGKLFSEPRTVREITDYCNRLYGESRPVTDYTAILERVSEKGALRKIELLGGNIQYQQV